MKMKKILQVKDLHFQYKNNILFDSLSFDLTENKITSFLSLNKCGKTTLINILSGILRVKSSIVLDDLELNKKNIKKYLKQVGVVFENIDNQFCCSTIYEELVFPLENLCYSKDEIKERLDNLAELFRFKDLDKEIDSLSYYEKIKLLLAIAISHKPKLLLLDNPFLLLSDEERKKIFRLLRKVVKKENITIFLTTNSLIDFVLSDYGMVFNEKKLIYYSTPLEVLEHDNELAKMGFYIPVMIDLSLKLKFYNLMDTILLDSSEVVEKLWP